MEQIEKAAVTFIRQARQLGETDEQIIQTLIAQGVTQSDILAAFLEVNGGADYQQIPAPVTPIPSPELITHEVSIPPEPFRIPIKLISFTAAVVILGLVWFGATRWGPQILTKLPMYKPTPTPFDGPALLADAQRMELQQSVLHQDIDFQINGSEVMPSLTFTPPQLFEVPLTDDRSLLLIYYSATNTTDHVRGFFDGGIDDTTANVYTADAQRLNTHFELTKLSLIELTELIPFQYTTNAIIFDIPSTYVEASGLYVSLDLDGNSTKKRFIRL